MATTSLYLAPGMCGRYGTNPYAFISCTRTALHFLNMYAAGPTGRAVWCVGLRPLACWDCVFESQSCAWMSVCCECCVFSGRGLCDGPIPRPDDSYWVCCVVLCDLETSWIRRLWPTGGAVKPKTNKQTCMLQTEFGQWKILSDIYVVFI